MLEERETATQQPEQSFADRTPGDEWTRQLRAWAACHPVHTEIAEDNRESIYEGRGE